MRKKPALWIAAITTAAVLTTAGVAVVTTGALSGLDANDPRPVGSTPLDAGEAGPRPPEAAAEAFLADWVDDGRVVRRDQGGDTVSEGQAYGLLIALAADDEDSFDAIWTWTEENMQRSDGLLAWRWDGEIVDDEPASDADLDAARALVLAGQRWERDDFDAAGTALAGDVADLLTVQTASGRVLAPGLWAVAADPHAYNPSYASPAAFAVLGDHTGDPRWSELADGSRDATTELLDLAALPSDWARVTGEGSLQIAAAAGDGDGVVLYGYDAARLPIRYAESCDPADVALAARLAAPLGTDDPLAAQLDLGGAAQTGDEHPVSLAGRAGARAAAADADGARADLMAADRLAQEQQTYYGAAWAALAPALLTDTDLGGCAPLGTEAAS